jgi:hypothetical protein
VRDNVKGGVLTFIMISLAMVIRTTMIMAKDVLFTFIYLYLFAGAHTFSFSIWWHK